MHLLIDRLFYFLQIDCRISLDTSSTNQTGKSTIQVKDKLYSEVQNRCNYIYLKITRSQLRAKFHLQKIAELKPNVSKC